MLIEDNILLLKQCFVSNINQIPLPNNMQPFNSFQSLGSVGYEAGVTVSSLLDAFWPPGVLCSVLGSRLKVSMAWETNCPKLDRFGLRVGVPHVRHRVSRWGLMPCWRNMTIPGDWSGTHWEFMGWLFKALHQPKPHISPLWVSWWLIGGLLLHDHTIRNLWLQQGNHLDTKGAATIPITTNSNHQLIIDRILYFNFWVRFIPGLHTRHHRHHPWSSNEESHRIGQTSALHKIKSQLLELHSVEDFFPL